MKCVPLLRYLVCSLWILVLISSVDSEEGSTSDEKGEMRPEQRIIGGKEVKLGDYPHQVLVRFKNSGVTMCGGTIISDEFVLLAAHCFLSIDGTVVYTGIINISSILNKTSDAPVPIQMAKVFIHPCYGLSKANDITRAFNDIALIKTASKIPLNDNTIKTIQIDEQDLASNGSLGIVLGWGGTKVGMFMSSFSSVLKEAEMEVDTKFCLNENTTADAFHAKFSEKSQICIYRDNQSPCGGDSGGPLLCKDKNGQNTLCAIASLVLIQNPSQQICTGQAVYTRVYYYRHWIKSVIEGTLDQNPEEHCYKASADPRNTNKSLTFAVCLVGTFLYYGTTF